MFRLALCCIAGDEDEDTMAVHQHGEERGGQPLERSAPPGSVPQASDLRKTTFAGSPHAEDVPDSLKESMRGGVSEGLLHPVRKGAKHYGGKALIWNRGVGAWEKAKELGLGRIPRAWRPAEPRLLVFAATLATLRQYLAAVGRFLGFCAREQEPLESVEQLDRALVWYMAHAAYEGKQNSAEGKNVQAGVMHLLPGMKGSLPQAARALKAWEKQEGVREREPLCGSRSALLVERMGKEFWLFGCFSFAQLRDLLREQDGEALRGEDVNVAVVNGTLKVSLSLGVLERGETTKKGTSQGGEVLGELLKEFYARRKEEVGDKGYIFEFQMNQYRSAFQEVLKEMGLGDLGHAGSETGGPHLHRHSGAIYYIHYLNWTLKSVKDRGRWGADESVAHYAKKHLLIKNEGRATAEEDERGRWLWEDPKCFGLRMAMGKDALQGALKEPNILECNIATPPPAPSAPAMYQMYPVLPPERAPDH